MEELIRALIIGTGVLGAIILASVWIGSYSSCRCSALSEEARRRGAHCVPCHRSGKCLKEKGE